MKGLSLKTCKFSCYFFFLQRKDTAHDIAKTVIMRDTGRLSPDTLPNPPLKMPCTCGETSLIIKTYLLYWNRSCPVNFAVV